MHVVFDREVYASVRGQDLGSVRGQPIRPVLAGFGEPFTDWLFQTSLHAASGQSAFSLRADESWLHGRGWLLVYALRWMGKSRRISTADSIVVCHVNEAGEVRLVISTDSNQIGNGSGFIGNLIDPRLPMKHKPYRPSYGSTRWASRIVRQIETHFPVVPQESPS